MRQKEDLRRTALIANRWSGVRMLETAYRLNERCFALLAEAAKLETPGIECNVVHGLQELWARVGVHACERARSCPVLLLDLNFQRPAWWNNVHRGELEGGRVTQSCTLFTQEQAAPVLREILMEAWSIGRSMPSAANLLFGMAPSVSEAIASLSVAEVDRVVADHARCLRPRWEESRPFWSQLLEAVLGSGNDALADVHLHCLQLVGTGLTPTNG
jgi:hypothetical protein